MSRKMNGVIDLVLYDASFDIIWIHDIPFHECEVETGVQHFRVVEEGTNVKVIERD